MNLTTCVCAPVSPHSTVGGVIDAGIAAKEALPGIIFYMINAVMA